MPAPRWPDGTKKARQWSDLQRQGNRYRRTGDARTNSQKIRDMAVKEAKKTRIEPDGIRLDLIALYALSLLAAVLGPDAGRKGAGRAVLVNSIRAYRLSHVSRLWSRWHPEPGSSGPGLAAARAGMGLPGVLDAIAHCGCMMRGVSDDGIECVRLDGGGVKCASLAAGLAGMIRIRKGA